jgi:photosynthetic reaction center cytochrome c subunit
MMHMSTALGVNCTYCHNTRAMGEWSLSPATRATAWYGIRMVRDLNKDYLEPLLGTLPPERLGKTGDVPKANCATCHQGAYKPLLGVSMLKDYAALARPMPQPEKTPEPPPQSEGMDGIDGGAPEGGASNDARTGATPSGGN